MNKLILSGNLTRDPELTETSSGITVCRFAIAVNRDYTKDNERVVDFFNITVWRTQAENCNKYLRKGSKVLVTARIQNRSYEDKEGNRMLVTDIIASDIEFLSPIGKDTPTTDQQQTNNRPTTDQQQTNNRPTTEKKASKKPSIESCDDDLPF